MHNDRTEKPLRAQPLDPAKLAQALEFVLEIAQNAYDIPENAFKSIAHRAVLDDQVSHREWVQSELDKFRDLYFKKREYAKKHGFSPFTSMGKFAYDWIKKNCGEWVLPKMAVSLKDPEDIHPEWAIQCAKTMSMLGREVCEQEANLYTFITTHPEWQNQKITRDRFKKEWDNTKRHWERQNRVKIQIVRGSAPKKED